MNAKTPGLWLLASQWMPPYVLCQRLDLIILFYDIQLGHSKPLDITRWMMTLFYLSDGLRILNRRLDIEKRAYKFLRHIFSPLLVYWLDSRL